MEIVKNYRNILLHVPHSSTAFPEDSSFCFKDLDDEEQLLIDYFTDELFVPRNDDYSIKSVVFPYCRLFCDVERLINDPLETKGLGISYNRTVGSKPNEKRTFSCLSIAFNYYADHHANVSKKIVNTASPLLLIDCHSFSNLPNLLCSNPPDIDICIGFNEDETCPNKAVIGKISHFFASFGYKVGINEPYSNSKTFSVPIKYHSLMIEINKRSYMDEETLEKQEGFMRIHQILKSLYKMLLMKD